jgi:TfoX/Sxy family transcriptional regulator of competence genes
MAYDEHLADQIRELLAGEAGITEMKMFGGLAFLIGGHMTVSASGQGGLLLRVEPDQTDALLEQPHAEPFVMRGRAMKGWMRVAPDGVGTVEALRPWVERGVAWARRQPPKQ